MKLSLLTSILAFSASVLATEESIAESSEAANADVETEREIVTDPNFVPTPEKPFNFKIEYEISFKEDKTAGSIADFTIGETVELAYTFKNLEPNDVAVVGVGGEMLDPITGENIANITASQIGPVEIVNNQTALFNQRVGINMDAGKYLLVPAVYVIYQDQFMLLGSTNKLVNVVEPTISFFNPQLILAELILGASIAGIGYLLYNAYATTYLSGILPASLLPADGRKKKAAVKLDASTDATTATKSADFESWLPDSHKNLTKKQKKKL